MMMTMTIDNADEKKGEEVALIDLLLNRPAGLVDHGYLFFFIFSFYCVEGHPRRRKF